MTKLAIRTRAPATYEDGEVEVPFYRDGGDADCGWSYDQWVCVHENASVLVLTERVNANGTTYEIEYFPSKSAEEIGYYAGKHPITREQFASAYQRFMSYVSQFGASA